MYKILFLIVRAMVISHLIFITNTLVSESLIDFRHLTVEDDGLSESTVYNIFQDSRGYIWISTDNGLNKYDGYTMKSYQYMHFDDRSISKGAPRTIFEDRIGNIWISTNAGFLNKLNPETEEFKRIDPLDIPNTEMRDVMKLGQLPDGRIIGPKNEYFVVLNEDGKNLKNIPMGRDSTFSNEFYSDLKEFTQDNHLIVKINSPGNSENLTEKFSISSEDSVLVVLMGEFELPLNGKYDYGWIEDMNGKKVWSPWDKDTSSAVFAGGNVFNRLTVRRIKLEPGDYKLRFISDAIYSAALWTMAPPDHPEFWGIGVYKTNKENQLNKSKQHDDSRLRSQVRDLEINDNGTIWVSNRTGMVLFDIDRGVIERFKTKYKYGLGEIIPDPYDENYLWCLGEDEVPGLCRFNVSTGMFKYYNINPDKTDEFIFNPNDLAFMNKNEIWLSSNNQGILRFNYRTGTAIRLVKEAGNSNALRDNRIYFLYLDRSGAMWVSTATMGISIYDPYYRKFGLIPYAQGLKNSFSNANVNVFGEDHNDKIIIGNGGDLYRFDPVKKELNEDNMSLHESLNNFDFFVSDSLGYFSSWDRINNKRVITKYDLYGKKIIKQWVHDKTNKNSVLNNPLEEILYDSRNILWISYVSINTISAKLDGSNVFIKYDSDLSMFNGKDLELARFIKKVSSFLQGYLSKILFEDSEGILWVGASNGLLFKIDVVNYKIDTYNHDPDDPTSIPSGMIVTISEDSRNNLWLGTWPTGMCRFDKKTGKSKRYYEKDGGLIDNTVCGIIEDDDGYLWISTKNGICKFNPVQETFDEYYYAEDGLQSNEFLFDGALKASNGTIYFGGSNGVTYFEPEKIFKNPNPPMMDISSIYKDGKKQILGLNSDEPSALEITYRDRGISFDFNALNYTRTEKNKYKYRMVGYDPDWVDAGDRRFTSYTNLPPGNYTFQVTGANNDGLWNEEPAQLEVKVYPPPWATWWAYSFYLISIIGSLYWYLQYIKKRNMRETEELRKTEELELARQFQLDLLPSKIPILAEYEIAANIATATEVGGDYYDFFVQPDGTLYLVTGDATGHGMTAGMMVSITKAGLHGISQPDTKDIMKQLNTVIKNIDLGQNRMALNIGHLKNGKIQFTSAGMPPIYLYSAETEKLNEILQVGLPLGSLKEEEYESNIYDFNKGDVLVFLSDGLPEATNASGKMIGYESVYDCIHKNIDQDPQTLLNSLSKLGTEWLESTPLEDDITIVIVKKK